MEMISIILQNEHVKEEKAKSFYMSKGLRVKTKFHQELPQVLQRNCLIFCIHSISFKHFHIFKICLKTSLVLYCNSWS